MCKGEGEGKGEEGGGGGGGECVFIGMEEERYIPVCVQG